MRFLTKSALFVSLIACAGCLTHLSADTLSLTGFALSSPCAGATGGGNATIVDNSGNVNTGMGTTTVSITCSGQNSGMFSYVDGNGTISGVFASSSQTEVVEDNENLPEYNGSATLTATGIYAEFSGGIDNFSETDATVFSSFAASIAPAAPAPEPATFGLVGACVLIAGIIRKTRNRTS